MKIIRWVGRLLTLVLIGDGLITLIWGRGFIAWQRRLAPDWYEPVLSQLLRWPESLLRLGATGEAALGGVWLAYLVQRKANND